MRHSIREAVLSCCQCGEDGAVRLPVVGSRDVWGSGRIPCVSGARSRPCGQSVPLHPRVCRERHYVVYEDAGVDVRGQSDQEARRHLAGGRCHLGAHRGGGQLPRPQRTCTVRGRARRHTTQKRRGQRRPGGDDVGGPSREVLGEPYSPTEGPGGFNIRHPQISR